MILPHTHTAALLLMFFSLFCWGSWANTLKRAGKWRFELYYFDFAIGLAVVALILAFTFGSLGYDGFSLLDDLMSAGKRQWVYGFAGGVIFNLGNLALVAAISVVGMAVAFPMAFACAIIVGALLGYAVQPFAHPALLVLGCAILVLSILVNSAVYRNLQVQRHEALARSGKAKSTRRPSSIKGVLLSLASGLMLALFAPVVELGRNGEIPMGPYSIALLFAAGAFFSTFIFNLFFMNLPVDGEPLELAEYFQGRPTEHLLGMFGGALWICGMVASYAAMSAPDGHQIGAAAGYAVLQGSAVISALWGIFAWKEFAGADSRIKAFAVLTLVLFGCGLGLVSLAPIYVR
ncbi:MAG TPA: hypothetical protein VG675_16195 [Bryobacteraceae bacterium]|nr:hypothetical protein [Bryobacteraceae bacterium]